MYALLLFGGPVSVNHVGGGLAVGSGDGTIKLRAWPRIGTLVNQLRCVELYGNAFLITDVILEDDCWRPNCSSASNKV